ncbi:MAG TPA: hypothetical protein VFV41_27500 [Streptosporangiaceae bacterium]|nr:hypothetical protein [Streptosporangiaceae bacterium]
MRGDLAGIRPGAGLITAALAALAVGLAGCGSPAGTAGPGRSASPGAAASSIATLPSGSASQAAGNAGGGLARSRLRVLTRLTKSQLCGVVPAEAARLLGAPVAAPVYASQVKLGITCQWVRKDATATSQNELYVGISSVIGWAGARQADKVLRTRPVTVSGHQALAASPQGNITWGQVDVALGGDHDPVAEYRAPTLARAIALARALTPRIVAMG